MEQSPLHQHHLLKNSRGQDSLVCPDVFAQLCLSRTLSVSILKCAHSALGDQHGLLADDPLKLPATGALVPGPLPSDISTRSAGRARIWSQHSTSTLVLAVPSHLLSFSTRFIKC